jgi:energy-converting hydrogenase Eha subunit F
MLVFFTAVLNFFKNPKSWVVILFVFIALLIAYALWQRSRAEDYKLKYEAQVLENKRIENNNLASLDTIRAYKDKNGNLTGEILAFRLKEGELDSLYHKYFSLYLKEKNKEPKTVIQVEYVIVQNIKAPTVVTDSTILYKDSISHGKIGNYTKIEGKIPYTISQHIKKDKTFEYGYNNAVLYCYNLQTRGFKDAEVVAFTNKKAIKNTIIPISEAVKDTTSFFRIFLKESTTDIKDEIAYMSGIDKDFIDDKPENGIHKYYTGIFVPKQNIEPFVELKELLIYPKLWTGLNSLNIKETATLLTSIYKDKETGKLLIQVKSDNPNITFSSIRGAEILSEDKTVSRGVRKEFGLGLNIGIGGMLTPVDNGWGIKAGPVISVGLNWTPRWLQFGPSSSALDEKLKE